MKLARIAIFLTGMIGLMAGGLTAISSLKTGQEQAQIRANENLKAQATLMVDQFYSALDSAKKSALATNLENAPSFIVSRGEIAVINGAPGSFDSFTSEDLALQERVLNSVKAQVSMNDLKLSKLQTGIFDLNETGNKVGIFLVIPGNNEKLVIALIDPVKAIAGLEKMNSSGKSGYLIYKDGRVLAHSVSSFVGTNLKKVATLKDSLENLFLGAQTGMVERYSQVDGTKESAAFVRAGALPFALAVEEKAISPVLSSEWLDEQWASGAARKNLGVAMMLIAICLVMFSLLSAWATRSVKQDLKAFSENRDSPGLAPESGRIAPSLVEMNAATEKFAINRERSESARESARANAGRIADPESLSRLLSRVQGVHALEAVERELASFSHELTGAPVLVLRYQRQLQNLSLASVSGNLSVENWNTAQAYVRKDIELQVEQLSDSGKIASLTQYAPIKKLLQAIAPGRDFEAWALTSTPDVSLQSKLTGVLILMDPSSQSPQVRPLLAGLIKEIGNYLYAQGNRIRSKSSPAQGVSVRVDAPSPGQA